MVGPGIPRVAIFVKRRFKVLGFLLETYKPKKNPKRILRCIDNTNLINPDHPWVVSTDFRVQGIYRLAAYTAGILGTE